MASYAASDILVRTERITFSTFSSSGRTSIYSQNNSIVRFCPAVSSLTLEWPFLLIHASYTPVRIPSKLSVHI